MPIYPQNTTLQESYLCVQCLFKGDNKDDKICCKRSQEMRDGCLILASRH